MALDVLPDEIIVKDRDEWLALYLRSHQLRAPGASVAQDSEPYVTGSAIADQLTIQSENARQIGRSIPLASISGARLDQLLQEKGLPARFPETGSQGAFLAVTSLNGSNIPAGTELTDNSGQLFDVTITQVYLSGQTVPIAAKSTGPATNLAAGTQLTFSAPPGGSVPKVVVATQTDGTGLSGGRLAETDDEVRGRISDANANPAAAGNDAAYQRAIEFSEGHGVAVQKAFTYPAVMGPGTTAFCFLLSAAGNGSRIPNSTQIQIIRDYLVGQFPADDGIFDCIVSPQFVDIAIRVTWADGAAGWVDPAPWPPYYLASGTPSSIVVTSATSPVSFSVDCLGGTRTGAIAPQVGNNVAFFDIGSGVFQQKRILSVTGTGPWALTVDTSNGVSNTTYTPAIGQRVCPWSDSLSALVPPVTGFIQSMGPGEQYDVNGLIDPGFRRKRSPPSPRKWPSVITNNISTNVLALSVVNNATIVEGLNQATNVGVPGALSYLIELNFFSVFPLT